MNIISSSLSFLVLLLWAKPFQTFRIKLKEVCICLKEKMEHVMVMHINRVISIFSKHTQFPIFCWNIILSEKSYSPLQILQFFCNKTPACLFIFWAFAMGPRTSTLILFGLTVFYRMQLEYTFWILQAATSGSRVGAPRVWASLSRSSCSRISFMNFALSRPCRARSWTWIILMASSSDILSSSFCCQNIS